MTEYIDAANDPANGNGFTLKAGGDYPEGLQIIPYDTNDIPSGMQLVAYQDPKMQGVILYDVVPISQANPSTQSPGGEIIPVEVSLLMSALLVSQIFCSVWLTPHRNFLIPSFRDSTTSLHNTGRHGGTL